MNKLSFDPGSLLDSYKPDFAMSYGSGVFEQNGYSQLDKPMIDFVFGVDNTKNWHKSNLRNNKKDYSSLVQKFPFFINALQEYGAKIYYNHYCDFESNSIKYGVLSLDDLVDDLINWNYLYVAGRLHKPVHIIKSNDKISKAIDKNLENALITSLLLLPEKFTINELFIKITSISYMGDFRMGNFENPKKVSNIVDKNLDGFMSLYKSKIDSLVDIINFQDENNIIKNLSYGSNNYLVSNLPSGIKSRLSKYDSFNSKDFPNFISSAVSNIVRPPSIKQPIKGFFTGGPINSFLYVSEKRKKSKNRY